MTSSGSALSSKLLPEVDRERVLFDWGTAPAEYPRDRTVASLVDEIAAVSPDAIALVAPSPGVGTRTLSYAELVRRSRVLAAELSTLGVGHGDRVALVMTRSPETIVAMLAVLRTRAAFAPIDPDYPAARLRILLDDLAPKVVLTEPAHLDVVPSHPGVTLTLTPETGNGEIPGTHLADGSGEDAAYVMYTSGSTGKPKGVVVPNRAIVRLVVGTTFTPLNARTRFLQLAPLAFDASTLEIWGPLLAGGTVVLFPGSGVPEIEQLEATIRDFSITHLWLTASLFNLIVDTRIEALAPLEELLTGGEALSVDHVRKALEGLPGTTIVNGYGPTECTTFACCHRIERPLPDPISSIPIGSPVANTRVYVVDAEGRPVAIGETGELVIGGDGLAIEYLGRPELTAASFVEGGFGIEGAGRLYRTGDLVRWLETGVIEYLGRVDEQVKLRGHRIELGEVASVVRGHPSIAEAVAIVREDAPGDKRLVAYVVAKGSDVPTTGTLHSYVAARLPAPMVPSAFVPIARLPLTENGKLDKRSLPRPGARRPDVAEPFVAPRTRLEALLAQHFEAVLGIDRIGVDDRFFELGGTSLLAISLVRRIGEAFSTSIPLVAFFDAPTIASLATLLVDEFPDAVAAHVDHEADRPSTATAPRPRRRGTEPSNGRPTIAVVGMSGRFPRAKDISAFWANLDAGVECVTPITAEHLRALGKDESLLENPDFVAATFALEGAEMFDAPFFGFTPREAEFTDPQIRLMLELASSALEHAGYDSYRYEGRIGVFGGVGRNSYLLEQLAPHRHHREALGQYAMLVGNERDFATTHVSYRLDLEGPSVDVQTACSTSGVAIHLACQSLRNGDSDMALVGGCKVICPNADGYFFVEGGPLAPEGHVRAFSDDANGMVRGSGGAMLVLKRLDDALRDGDSVYGIVAGSAINNDGSRKVGFTAPSIRGQAEVIREALADASLDADAIDYVEAHGTGTKIGDPIEVAALTRAFRADTDRVGYCALGSVKTNIGHLDAGATVAGIVKTLLAFEHESLPASLNFRAPNPEIDFATSPFFVNAETRPWPRGARTRRAGVSSFGLGGTNAHLILEEPPVAERTEGRRRYELLVISARSEASLEATARALGQHLAAHPELTLADVAHTLEQGRRELDRRCSVAVSSIEDAAACLASFDRRRISVGADKAGGRDVVFLFPGGGAQYAGMARGLYDDEPVFRAAVDRCAAIATPIIGLDLRTLLFPDADVEAASARMEAPSLALPTLFTIEWSLAELFSTWGIVPAAMIGHSMGEYVAACRAGVMSLEDGLALVACRGRLFETLREGAMLGVPLPEAEARARAGEGLCIAAVNRPNQTVVSGEVGAIDELATRLAADGIDSTRIHIRVAAHSRLVEPILAEFREFIRSIALAAPRVPVISNLTGAAITAEQATSPDYWVEHLRNTVRFGDGLESLLAGKDRVLIEVGPGQTLSSFARQHPSKTERSVVVASLRHPQESIDDSRFFATTLGRLWNAGVAIDWRSYRAGEKRRRVGLSTYAFDRKRHWVDAPRGAYEESTRVGARVEPVASPFESSTVVASVDASVDVATTRRERILRELARIISESSGLPAESIDVHATFLELGFDSLFLTQANAQFRGAFGVKMGVRALLEKTPTLDSLASFLDAEMPAGAEPGAPIAAKPAARPERGADTASVAIAPADRTSPWQPIQKSDVRASDGLTPKQRAHLRTLIAAVNARTPSSKRLAAQNRPHLADPRTVQGFKSLYKDIVYPIVSERAEGSRIYDVDGNEYIDLVCGYGVTFFGHAPDFILREVEAQLRKTIAIGPQTPLAGEVTKLVCELTGMERAALCNTGSEAVLAAVRMARTVTGKRRLATFSGHYHGIFDEVLVKGVKVRGTTRSLPISPGIRADVVEDVIVMDYGDPSSFERLREHAHEIALVLVEPIRSRNPDNRPIEFLRELRRLTNELDIPLLMDEMVTGFRTHPGGIQALWGVRADLATYGKVVGGGFPIGVVAGSAKFMDALDGGQWQYGDDSQPEADMTWFAGTFVRHPPALAAAKAVLLRLREEGPALQDGLAARVKAFADPLNAHFRATGTPIKLEYYSSFFVLKFTSFVEHSNLLFFHLHNRGVYTYEGRPAFITTAHTDADMQAVADAMIESVAELQRAGFLPGRPVQRDDEVVEIPLSSGQQEIWLATRFGAEASMAFNLASTIRLHGPLDVPALERALDVLVGRHEALRAVPNRDGLTQRILSPAKARVAIEVFDLRSLDGARASELARIERREVETPFDLENGPLVRARLVRLADDEHHFVLTAHHIVADGWSCGILLRDLGKLYAASVEGRDPALTPPMQLGEWIDREETVRESAEHKAALDYWLAKFRGTPPVLELPTDRPRPAIRTYAARRENLDLDASFVSEVKQLAARTGATSFVTLLAAFQTLLHRWTGQDDLVVGFSLAGQTNLDGRELVGHCVNFLPLRTTIDGSIPFARQVATARGLVFDAVEHQHFAFGELIKRLHLRRDPSRVPLMSVAFNLDPSSKGIGFANLDATPGSIPRRYENFDLFFNVVEIDDRFQIQCTFNEDLWDGSTVARFLAQYRVLLESTFADASCPIGRLAILPEAERRTLIETWNPPYVGIDPIGSIHARVSAAAAKHPEAIAVSFGDERISYADLEARANRLSHRLRAAGVGRESLVGVCLERSIDMVVALYATLKAGGAYVPLDPVNPDERLSMIVEDAGLAVLVTESALVGRVEPGSASVVAIDRERETLLALPDSPVEDVARESDLAYVIYTSGSTGKPKGVMVEHRQVMRLFDATISVFNAGSDDVWTMFHSYAFDFSVWEMWGPLTMGGRLVVVPHAVSRAPDRFLGLLAEERVTILNQTPSAFRQLIAADALDVVPRALSLRFVIFGGEALELASLRPWIARRGDRSPSLVNMYGITETTVHVTYRTITESDVLERRGSAIGLPIPDLQLYVVDSALEPVPIGVAGEIVVGGAGVARGYLRRPELTAERFVESPFRPGTKLYRSGDVGRFLPNRDLEYVGRADAQVKIRGYRIELGEIEATIGSDESVADIAIIARTDDSGEKSLVAYCVPKVREIDGGLDGRESHKDDWRGKWALLYQSGRDALARSGASSDKHLDDEAILDQLSAQEDFHAEWLEFQGQTIDRITKLPLGDVMEIGCGTGQVFLRIAPLAKSYYGTDFAELGVAEVERQIDLRALDRSRVRAAVREAVDFDGVAPESLDLVILNSVSQYFPDVDYFLRVIRNAVTALRAGGCFYIGDVQSRTHLFTHHANDQIARAAGSTTLSVFRRIVDSRVLNEDELVIDPELFHALAQLDPRISRVEVVHRRGRIRNETTRYHYDVFIYVDSDRADATATFEPWDATITVDSIRKRLAETLPDRFCLGGVANDRIVREVAIADEIRTGDPGRTVADLLAIAGEVGGGIDPETLFELEAELPYDVSVLFSSGPVATFDVVFRRRGSRAAFPARPFTGATSESLGTFANSPHLKEVEASLVRSLREFASARLPDYMVPSQWVILDRLPLTPNGKLDVRALPVPAREVGHGTDAFVTPTTETEKGVAEIFAEILKLERIGATDDFFELGGHSLLAVQCVMRLRERFEIDLALGTMFTAPTISSLARTIDATRYVRGATAVAATTADDVEEFVF